MCNGCLVGTSFLAGLAAEDKADNKLRVVPDEEEGPGLSRRDS